MIFSKNKYTFEKMNDQHFVLVNTFHNVLRIYSKDTKIIWDALEGIVTVTYDDLYDLLILKGFELDKKDLHNILEDLVRSGMLICNTLGEDHEYIFENNQLETYCDYTASQRLPPSLILELTNECNLKCSHCFHDQELELLSLQEVTDLFKQLINSQFIQVILTGGELTMLPYWKEIVLAAQESGLIVNILSNFTLINHDDIDFIINTNVYSVRTSLYGINNVHDSICGIKGAFQRTYSALEYFSNNNKKTQLSVNCTIMQNNKGQILELKTMMDALGIEVYFSHIVLPSRNGTKDIKKMMISNNDFNSFVKEGILSKSVRIPCSVCENKMRISQSGAIYGCQVLDIPLGNIKEDNFLNVISGPKAQSLIKKAALYNPDKCNSCKYSDYCSRCPAFVWTNQSTNINTHSDLSCTYREIEYGSLYNSISH